MASDHSASSAMILCIQRTLAPEFRPFDFSGGGINEGFDGCGPVLEAWPTVEAQSWVKTEDWLGADTDGGVRVSCMLWTGNIEAGGPLVMAL